jgi:hypothetical protein
MGLLGMFRSIRSLIPPLVDERFLVVQDTAETRERVILRWLLRGSDPVVVVLRHQTAAARVLSREYTKNGFVTEFAFPAELPRFSLEPIEFADQELQIEGLEFGAGAVLYVRNGLLTKLEGECWGPEAWPRGPIVLRSATPAG